MAPATGAADDATGRERHHARLVGQRGARRHGRCLVDGHVVGGDDAGASFCAIALDQLAELGEHGLALTGLGAQHLVEIGDGAPELVALLLELELFELGQPAQLHVEDGRRLDLAELELRHQSGARLVAVFGTPDDLDDGVDRVEREEQALDDVHAIVGLAQAKLRALDDDIEAVIDVVLAQVIETEGGGHAVDQHDVVDAERVFHRCLPVEVGEHRVRIDRGLARDLDAQPVRAIAQVDDVVDAADLVVDHELFDAADDALGADHEGQLGDDDALAAAALEVDDLGLGPHADGAATGFVCLADAVVDDDATGGEVGTGQHGQQLVEGRSRPPFGQHQLDGFVDLAQVVRGHVGGHADGDAGGAVDEQVRQHGGQAHGLAIFTVVARPEIDRLFVELVDHVHRGRAQPAFGVALRRRRIIERAEVALWIDEA